MLILVLLIGVNLAGFTGTKNSLNAKRSSATVFYLAWLLMMGCFEVLLCSIAMLHLSQSAIAAEDSDYRPRYHVTLPKGWIGQARSNYLLGVLFWLY